MFDINFYRGKKVFITGHTGFKGSWMVKALLLAGANITGYALMPPTNPSLFNICDFNRSINSIITDPSSGGSLHTVIGDISNLDLLMNTVTSAKPEIIIHMAAQPIVRQSYVDPVGTYMSNVMGTVNILECARLCDSVRSVINVTTDKVYLNREFDHGYTEDEQLNGYDPYSNSKSCSELVTSSYKNSFFNELIKGGRHIAVTTMRAGNVIGGGDYAKDRIIPDCIRAAMDNMEINVRNPYSTRPYQHVLEPVMAYLMVAAMQYDDISYASSYNVGPNDDDCYATGDLVSLFCDKWGNITWKNTSEANAPHEANFLKLDSTKLKKTFNWSPRWSVEDAMLKIVEWTKSDDKNETMKSQILEYLNN